MSAQSGQIPPYRVDVPTAVLTPPRKSWLRRNWFWLLGGMFVCGVLFIFGIGMLAFGAMRRSDVAKAATAAAQSNAAVQQSLGTPIEEGFFVSGSVNVSGDSGDADLSIPISGPKGKATVYATAHKTAGNWSYSVAQVAIAGTGQRVNLLTAAPTSQAQPATPTAPTTQTAAADPPAAQPAAADSPAPSAAAAAAPPPSDAAPSSGPASDVIQSQDSTTSGIVAELIQARRSEGVLTIKVRFRNTSNKHGAVSFTSWNENDNPKYYVTAGNKKYFLLADTDGTALSTNSTGNGVAPGLDPGQTYVWWGKYPAPPSDVKKFNFMMPVTTPFEDIPITDK